MLGPDNRHTGYVRMITVLVLRSPPTMGKNEIHTRSISTRLDSGLTRLREDFFTRFLDGLENCMRRSTFFETNFVIDIVTDAIVKTTYKLSDLFVPEKKTF